MTSKFNFPKIKTIGLHSWHWFVEPTSGYQQLGRFTNLCWCRHSNPFQTMIHFKSLYVSRKGRSIFRIAYLIWMNEVRFRHLDERDVYERGVSTGKINKNILHREKRKRQQRLEVKKIWSIVIGSALMKHITRSVDCEQNPPLIKCVSCFICLFDFFSFDGYYDLIKCWLITWIKRNLTISLNSNFT